MRDVERRPTTLFGFLMLVVVCVAPVRAHVVDLGAARGRLLGDSFSFSVDLPMTDVERLLPPGSAAADRNGSHFESLRPLLVSLAPQLWEVKTNGSPAAPLSVEVNPGPTGMVSFQLSFLRLGAKRISLRARQLAPGQREFVVIESQDGSARVEKMLTATDDTLEFELSEWGELISNTPTPSANRGGTFFSFLRLGVEHIWTGYDHLLFLFGLLVVCRSFRSIVSTISFFTVAHSLTLGLATLGVVNVPSRITEPAIAASIVFVSIENLVRRGREPRARWAVTFAFGLVHGFGFATVLRDLGVGTHGESIAVPLFSFNLGVELGQIAIAAVALPLLWQLRKRETFVRMGVPALSAVSALAGMFWLVQRTVFA